MHALGLIGGALLVLLVFWEAFETIVYPRPVARKVRLTRIFVRVTWLPWRALARLVPAGGLRENFLSVYGPLSLLALLVVWAVLIVVGFALMHWGLGSHLQTPRGLQGLPADLYFSGATLFTLSLGDVTPLSRLERLFTVLEAGSGIALLALVIGYLPSLGQAFSRREVNVTLLDARAGSPPSAGELLRRHQGPQGQEALAHLLDQWDRWAAEVLETHVSFPLLAYYRSQHANQSWLAALTTILDVCALILAGLEPGPVRPARTAFHMARHAAADMTHALRLTMRPLRDDRLPAVDLARLRQALGAADLTLRNVPEVNAKLERLRETYEPYVTTLAGYLMMPLPSWVSTEEAREPWCPSHVATSASATTGRRWHTGRSGRWASECEGRTPRRGPRGGRLRARRRTGPPPGPCLPTRRGARGPTR
jgi:hypothetical protein